jgi:hypothetical protein
MSWGWFGAGLALGGTVGVLLMGLLASEKISSLEGKADHWRQKHQRLLNIMQGPLDRERGR